MFGLGMGELIVIFFVIFLLFGPKALPDIARGLGQAIKLFKQEMSKINEEIQKDNASSKSTTDISFKKEEKNSIKNS